jgi:hypothetical protein
LLPCASMPNALMPMPCCLLPCCLCASMPNALMPMPCCLLPCCLIDPSWPRPGGRPSLPPQIQNWGEVCGCFLGWGGIWIIRRSRPPSALPSSISRLQICAASCCLCVRCGVRVVCEWCAGCAYEAVAVGGGGPPGESTGKSILTGSALLSASTGG